MSSPSKPVERPADSPSELEEGSLAFFKATYEILYSIGMRFLRREETVENPFEGHVAFYEKMFDFEVRLHLHFIAQEFFTAMNLAPP